MGKFNMALNVFAAAKVIPATPVAAKKSKKAEVEMTGLEMYALWDATEKAAKSMKETYRVGLEPQMKDDFVRFGKADSYTGVEGNAKASVELRKRSSASGLDDAELAACKEHHISVEKAVAQPERFVFNPAYLEDPKMMERISKAIQGIKDVPEDLILKQPEVFKTVVTETSLEEVFRIGDKKVVKQLLSIVGTLALKPTIANFDLEVALKRLHDQVQEDRIATQEEDEVEA